MALIKIEIKHRGTGEILFSFEKNNNSIKDTLVEAVKQKIDLHGADLYGADLRNANLYSAYLRCADLRNVDLSGAYLGSAYLNGANLSGANLKGVNLCEVYLNGANLSGAKEISFVPLYCPSDGAFIGWKKAFSIEDGAPVLVKLEIPADARRSSATRTKCRCDKAKVLEIIRMDNGELEQTAESEYISSFIYRVGEMVEEPNFCEDRWQECAAGIHFFINKQDAIEY